MGKKIFSILALSLLAGVQCVMAGDGNFKETYITPTRVMWTDNNVKNIEMLTEPFVEQQVATNDGKGVVMRTENGKIASLLLDFGKELHAGLKIYAGMRPSQAPVTLRVTYGESVTEAMSTICKDNPQNPTNDHAMREFTIQVPWLGSASTGFSGFRFARIDLLTENEDFLLRAVEAVSRMRDYDYTGAFTCNDSRLNDIWQTAAYTVHLNMQEYIWDGIKRDRLVWLGDLNPEVMAICNVFGPQAYDLIHKSLDFGSHGFPLPNWINGMSSYSLWWIINQYDLYMYEGNDEYLREQLTYMNGLIDQFTKYIDAKTGEEKIPGGFLDWPTSQDKVVVHAGMQALALLSFERAAKIGEYMGDKALTKKSQKLVKLLKKFRPAHNNNTQASSLYILSGLSKDIDSEAQNILNNGMDQYSTFYGYYVSEALAKAGYVKEAIENISTYWGSMLDVGATSFWEDHTYKNVANAGRIDDFVPEGKYDIHADGGAFCYIGLRLSLCHGWASGPTPFMIRNVLGITPEEPGCKTIRVKPNLGNLTHAEGVLPTPQGNVKVIVEQNAAGQMAIDVDAPKGIKVLFNDDKK